MVVFREPTFEVVYKVFTDDELYSIKGFPFKTGEQLENIILEKAKFIQKEDWANLFAETEAKWLEELGISYIDDITRVELAGIKVHGDNQNGDSFISFSFDINAAVTHLAPEPEE